MAKKKRREREGAWDGWMGTCPHCRDFYAHHGGEAQDHNLVCNTHLFCKDRCSKGRAVFMDELATKIAAKLCAAKRGDLGEVILTLLEAIDSNK